VAAEQPPGGAVQRFLQHPGQTEWLSHHPVQSNISSCRLDRDRCKVNSLPFLTSLYRKKTQFFTRALYIIVNSRYCHRRMGIYTKMNFICIYIFQCHLCYVICVIRHYFTELCTSSPSVSSALILGTLILLFVCLFVNNCRSYCCFIYVF
jgi:hypothetical protein